MPSAARHLVEPDSDPDDRYHRQSLITWWDQDRLADSSVLVTGAGALGNELVKNLALLGIGRIVIADMDRIEHSNLSRCVLFREADEGKLKAEVVAERAMELNPEVNALPVVGDVRTSLGLGVFAEVDVVLGGLDNREARLFVNQACWKTSTPWIDGAIEGLMGVVRVFDPPKTACYACTMSDRDLALVARRRACSLLSRDDMLEGKVPTTATASSVMAGLQAQEAVKMLHSDRVGESAIAGGGFQVNGLTHDSYVVRYDKREDCLAHDTYDLTSSRPVDPEMTLGQILERGREELGADTVLDLELEIVLKMTCGDCDSSEKVLLPRDSLTAGSAECPRCGRERNVESTHNVTSGDELSRLRPGQIGLPAADVVTARLGEHRIHFSLAPKGAAVSVTAAAHD